MDFLTADLIERISISVISAIITAFISVKLAMTKFKSEKVWVKSIECYSSILSDLSNIIVYSDLILEVKDNVQHDKQVIDKHKSLFNESVINLQHHVNVSYLYLDKSSYEALRAMYGVLFRIESGTENADKLSVLREEAEKNLDVISENVRSKMR
ncbi:TPA: hypothetical protein KD885_004342 [Vibrio parahaemolyticus]|nr:hypothetical protein [Vibrio parahaemolyticus]HBC3964678.1 hypothetical protein [Vibrio parahaemolyticus]HBH7878839.1 hypothetical protein [Vibrio parahaemolyticus]